MIVLIANLGSTSFKYKLFDVSGGSGGSGGASNERVLAVGAADRIGASGGSGGAAEAASAAGSWSVEVGSQTERGQAHFKDHGEAIDLHLHKLIDLGVIDSIEAVEAIGFKAVHGGPISGAVEVDDQVIATMESLYPLAPAHNPPYVAAMRSFKAKLPGVAQVAAFETAFHASIPLARQVYGVPYEWVEKHGIRRYGFHGASNAYITSRLAEIAPPGSCKKHITLHLGGSCSVCAVKDGRSVAHSMGVTPQTGTFHANRVGDFDTFALSALKEAGIGTDEALRAMSKHGGLLGISGVSSDMREVEAAAAAGNKRARLAVDAFVESCRHYLGAYLAVLNGADAIVFTAGIGQHGKAIREAICKDLDYAGIRLDSRKNAEAKGSQESRIDAADSRVAIWVLPTNEELIVARQTVGVLNKQVV